MRRLITLSVSFKITTRLKNQALVYACKYGPWFVMLYCRAVSINQFFLFCSEPPFGLDLSVGPQTLRRLCYLQKKKVFLSTLLIYILEYIYINFVYNNVVFLNIMFKYNAFFTYISNIFLNNWHYIYCVPWA